MKCGDVGFQRHRSPKHSIYHYHLLYKPVEICSKVRKFKNEFQSKLWIFGFTELSLIKSKFYMYVNVYFTAHRNSHLHSGFNSSFRRFKLIITNWKAENFHPWLWDHYNCPVNLFPFYIQIEVPLQQVQLTDMVNYHGQFFKSVYLMSR